jgi:ABC-type uncharacterized transport system involved in gliding motility auxiliary subunit
MKAIQTRSYAGLVVIGILFVLFNTLCSGFFKNTRIDLTEEKLYTLSEGSKAIVSELKDPVTLKYYFSFTDTVDIPTLHVYGERVRDLLESFTKRSPHLKLEVYDPRPDSEEAEWAEQYGFLKIPILPGENVFLGLLALNEMGDQQSIPYCDSDREEFLEYDIAKLISSVSSKKPLVGVYSPLPLEGIEKNQYLFGAGEKSQSWIFTTELKQLYDVKPVHVLTDLKGLDFLILIHPKDLNEEEEYAVDQYLLSGKNALILTDPFCESDNPSPQDPENPMRIMTARDSKLPLTLIQNGITMDPSRMILDRELASKVQVTPGQIVDYYVWLNIAAEQLNRENAITAKLEALLFPYSGFFSINPDSGLKVQTLIESSKTAGISPSSIMLMNALTPDKISAAYTPGMDSMPMAIQVSGSLKTAFPNGNPNKKEKAENKQEPESLTQSVKPTNMVLIADVDFLSNRFSVNIQNFLGNVMMSPLNDNMNFFFNALETLSGSSHLANVRSRGKFSRPFKKVLQIEAQAQAKWMQEETQLSQKVEEANQKLNELLQQEKSTTGLNQKIAEEVEKFRAEKLETQKKLRGVRKSLRQEKEFLGTQLFLINTFLVPILFLIYGIYRLLLRKKHSHV